MKTLNEAVDRMKLGVMPAIPHNNLAWDCSLRPRVGFIGAKTPLMNPMMLHWWGSLNQKMIKTFYAADVAKGKSISAGQMVFLDEDGKARAIIGDLSPGVKTMGYQDEQAKECAMAATPQKTAKQRLSPVIAVLVDYAERAGRAEAEVHFANREMRRTESNAERLADQLEDAKYNTNQNAQRAQYFEVQANSFAKRLDKYEKAEARKKAAAKKAKKPAKKATAKKSK